MTEPTLNSCPLCGSKTIHTFWFDEQQQFLVNCPHCTTYTITRGLASRFRCLLAPEERRMVERLSHHLRAAGDDDDREITEDSWLRLAAEG